MKFGFKVHTLEVSRGLSGRSRLPLRTCTDDKDVAKYKKACEEADAAGKPKPAPLQTGDYMQQFVEALNSLKARKLALTDVPKMMAVADGEDVFVPGDDPGTVRLRVTAVETHGRRVSVRVDYGHLGYAHTALAEEAKDDAPLDKKSPAQWYRMEFLIPDKGTKGLVVTESISRGSALPALVAWVNHVMREQHGDLSMLRLMVPQMTDLERLKAVMNGDTVSEIHLVQKSAAIDGVPDDGSIKVVEKVRSTNKMSSAKRLVGTWWDKLATDEKYTEDERLQQVQLLAQVVNPALAGIEFDDGIVKLDPGSGKKVEVRPSRVGELFTYDIAEARPGDTLWEDSVKTRALAMAKADGVSVAWG